MCEFFLRKMFFGVFFFYLFETLLFCSVVDDITKTANGFDDGHVSGPDDFLLVFFEQVGSSVGTTLSYAYSHVTPPVPCCFETSRRPTRLAFRGCPRKH